MTKEELKREADKLGFVVSEDEDQIHFDRVFTRFDLDKNKTLAESPDLVLRYKLIRLMFEYISTPIDKRDPEPLYRVRLMGFNSDNGHQYLTTKERGNAFGKVFACAYNPRLKQAFTAKELDALAERPDFKEEGWVQTLLYVDSEKITDNMTW